MGHVRQCRYNRRLLPPFTSFQLLPLTCENFTCLTAGMAVVCVPFTVMEQLARWYVRIANRPYFPLIRGPDERTSLGFLMASRVFPWFRELSLVGGI